MLASSRGPDRFGGLQMAAPEESDSSMEQPDAGRADAPTWPEPTSDEAAILGVDKPFAEWSYAEMEAYRLRGENEELRRKLARVESPAEAHRHAMRWAVLLGSVGAEFVLALVLSGTASTIFWVIFAAQLVALVAYGFSMSEYRDRRKHAN